MTMPDESDAVPGFPRPRHQPPDPNAAKRLPSAERHRPETPTLTDDLTGRFIRVGDRLYRTASDRKPIARLGPDRVRTANIDALPDIIRIAKANGWTSVRISGGDTFKNAAFLAATAQGLTVENYMPSKMIEAEAERLRRRLAAGAIRKAGREQASAPGRPDEQAPVTPSALAERFLRQTHEENARDPDLRRAQSLVAHTMAIARAKYPDGPAKASTIIEAKRQEVAERIASGDRIAGVQIRNEQARHTRDIGQDTMSRHGRAR